MSDGNPHLGCWVYVHSLRGVRNCWGKKQVDLSGKKSVFVGGSLHNFAGNDWSTQQLQGEPFA